MAVSKPKSDDQKMTPTEEQQEDLGTSAELKWIRPAFGMDRETGTGSMEALAEEGISGEMPADAVSRKKYYNAKAAFWRIMKYVVPIAVAMVVAFFIYMLSSVTGPIGKMQSDIEYLRKGNAELDNKLEKLPGDMLRSIGNTIDKIEADIENLRESDAKVNMEIEKMRKEMENGKRDR